MPTIGVLGPSNQTFGWMTAEKVIHELQIDCQMVAEVSQPDLLRSVLEGTSDHAACLVAYSNNLGAYAVTDIGRDITRFTRTEINGVQRLQPDQLIAIAQTKIQQCLIGVPGTNFSTIRKLYGHKEGVNQGSTWTSKFLQKGVEVVISESNGAAVNSALEEDNPEVAAIGPIFAVEDQSYVLHKGIDNNPDSETSFALIRNPNHTLEVPRANRHNREYGARIYGKVDPSHSGEVLFASAIASFGLSPYSSRSTNSPASGRTVIGQDIMANTKKELELLIHTMSNGYPELKIKIEGLNGAVTSLNGLTGGVEEINHLGPCPVIRV